MLIGASEAYSQKNIANLFKQNVYKGDEMYIDMYYNQAITYYKLALKKDSDNNSLKLKVASSYRLLNDYPSSLYWYEQVLNDSSVVDDPLDQYYYAEVLLAAGRFEDAAVWYKKYYMAEPTDSRGYRKLNGISSIPKLFRDSVTRSVHNLPINTEFNELAARKYNNGLAFLSSKKSNSVADHDFLREEDLLNIFYVEYDSVLGWYGLKSFDNSINSPYHEGPFAFYSNNEKMILTRSNIIDNTPVASKNGKTKLQLFTATKEDDHWSNVKGLSINNPEFSFAHPSLSAGNDTLYFSSDMEGGYGGNDIYMSAANGNTWSEPINMGYQINTEGDEMYPYYIDNRLFFSSNGHVGIGGLDIYKAFVFGRKIKGVVNLGDPINSSQDDIAYTINKTTLSGTFTSNRPGGAGLDDIYMFNYEAQVLSGTVLQEQDSSVIPDATVRLSQDGLLIDSTRSDADGQFYFHLPLNSDFELDVSKDEHVSIMPVLVSTRENVIDLDTLMISLHKHDLFARGRILNNETQELMEGVRVIIHNTSDNTLDTLYTSALGTYNFVLEPNKEYSIYVGKAGFLLGGIDINTFRISKGIILNDIVLELEYLKKNVVHFEFNKYDLTNKTKSILRSVAKNMKNSSKPLIISAFADARGTIEYNQILSDKRAAEVFNYLVSQGISKSRMTARGFGETLMINRCIDGVDCHEIEHSKNRRAEIKIEGSTVR